MKINIKKSLNAKLILYIVLTVAFVYATAISIVTINTRKMALEDAEKLADSYAREYSYRIRDNLNEYMDAARTLSQTFEDFQVIPVTERRKVMESHMRKVLGDNDKFLSVWTIWEPMVLDGLDSKYINQPGSTRIGNFSPTYYKVNGQIKLEGLSTGPLFVADYYTIPKRTLQETLLEANFYSYTGKKEDEILQTSAIVPLIVNDKFLGVVAIDIDLQNFQQLINEIRPFESSYAFLASNTGKFIAHPDISTIGKPISEKYNEENTRHDLFSKIKNGKKYSFTMKGRSSRAVNYISLTPITVGQSRTPLSIGVVVPLDSIMQRANHNLQVTFYIGFIGLLVIAFIIWLVAVRITRPLKNTTNVLKEMSKGKLDVTQNIQVTTHDEIGEMAGALLKLSQSLSRSAEFANEIGKGNLEQSYTPLSKNDILGNALLKMRESLQELSAANEANMWLQQSLVKISNVLRGEKTPAELANQVLSLVAGILDIQVGAIYVSTDEVLRLVGTYAFTIRKTNANEFKFGEGLVGQAALERKTILYTNVPAEYVYIESGLGGVTPTNILVIPMLYRDKVEGVMEIGTTGEINRLKMDFVQQMAEDLGIAFHSVTVNAEIKKLLQKTQEQAEELRVQQEELRQTNEELEEQTKALRNSEQILQAQQEELRVTNEELEEKTSFLEKQKVEIDKKNKDLEQAGRELEVKAQEMEQISKYKSEFLANMSHEIRTPLNSLLILSKSLSENKAGNLSKDQVEAADIIYKSGTDLLTLINDILDLAKIESGKMTMNFGVVNLKDIAGSMKRIFSPLAEQKKLTFEVTLEDGLPGTIYSDQIRLEQIIKNLLSNALKFTREGKVAFSIARPNRDFKLRQKENKASDMVMFSVSDTGIGIPEDKQSIIFEAFQQADGSTSRHYGGTGLGLSISRELAKMLHGEIHLVSGPDKGSTFSVLIPAKYTDQPVSEPEPSPTPAPKPAPKPAPLKQEPEQEPEPENKGLSLLQRDAEGRIVFIEDDRELVAANGSDCILVIEDDPNFANILKRQCHEKGFKCLATPSGENGLELAETFQPRAIILDINLPGIDGWAVLESLKNNAKIRHIPVHMMSGYDETIDAFQKGAIGYLRKPVDPEHLEAAFMRIEDFINRKMKDLLIVEDDDNLRKSIKNIIGESDVNISEAESGSAALNVLAAKGFDCMVMDLGLPDMSGFELLRQLEKLEKEGLVKIPPVIVYTGRELSREETNELQKYTSHIIIKGVKSEERLLDESALFLHRVVSELPAKQQNMISNLYDKDTFFQNKKILIVDDDLRNVFALSRVLAEKGMIVLKAEDGEMALDVLQKEKGVDLVLMDIMMPVMDGYEAISRIRQNPNFRNLPVIALTAKAMKEDREKCIEAGANDYLAKPLNVDRLMSLMRVWLY